MLIILFEIHQSCFLFSFETGQTELHRNVFEHHDYTPLISLLTRNGFVLWEAKVIMLNISDFMYLANSRLSMWQLKIYPQRACPLPVILPLSFSIK